MIALAHTCPDLLYFVKVLPSSNTAKRGAEHTVLEEARDFLQASLKESPGSRALGLQFYRSAVPQNSLGSLKAEDLPKLLVSSFNKSLP